MRKKIAILGSTGSIGTQAIEVVEQHPDKFGVELLTAHSNYVLLIEQARKLKPQAVVIANEKYYYKVFKSLDPLGIKVFAGKKSISELVSMDSIDMVLVALVGYEGLLPTIEAIKSRKQIALANKETLVVAGDLVTKLAQEYQVGIFPVDSEHSAIYQCLLGERLHDIEKVYLTASGGPFRGYDLLQLQKVSAKDALKHPNWNMGDKITIDSASLMNKGLEVIEAKWLFNLEIDQIEVIIHPQSVVHSLVQFTDGSIKAQMGLPDMKLPIQFALSFPLRIENNFRRFTFTDYPQLTFEKPDLKNFRNLALAFDALKNGGNMPCILNAANEIAVKAFLLGKINFLKIAEINELCMQKMHYIRKPQYVDYVESHQATIKLAEKISNI